MAEFKITILKSCSKKKLKVGNIIKSNMSNIKGIQTLVLRLGKDYSEAFTKRVTFIQYLIL